MHSPVPCPTASMQTRMYGDGIHFHLIHSVLGSMPVVEIITCHAVLQAIYVLCAWCHLCFLFLVPMFLDGCLLGCVVMYMCTMIHNSSESKLCRAFPPMSTIYIDAFLPNKFNCDCLLSLDTCPLSCVSYLGTCCCLHRAIRLR